jgi:hypothetical protein
MAKMHFLNCSIQRWRGEERREEERRGERRGERENE